MRRRDERMRGEEGGEGGGEEEKIETKQKSERKNGMNLMT